MNIQRTFFDDAFEQDMAAKRLARRDDPPTSHEAAEEAVQSGRLSKQCHVILHYLERGPCPSSMLAGVAQKYTSRISDLRKKGYKIKAYRIHDQKQWWYKLEE